MAHRAGRSAVLENSSLDGFTVWIFFNSEVHGNRKEPWERKALLTLDAELTLRGLGLRAVGSVLLDDFFVQRGVSRVADFRSGFSQRVRTCRRFLGTERRGARRSDARLFIQLEVQSLLARDHFPRGFSGRVGA